MIFVTKKGKPYLDRTIINDNKYYKVAEFIEGLGYTESDILTFEFSTNSKKSPPNIKELKNVLLKRGLNYNKKLENNIYKDFELLMQQAKEPVGNFLSLQGLFNYSTYPIDVIKAKNKIPKIGEKIKLYFYLFLECKFITPKECLVSFSGNFITSADMPTKNYFQKVESEFIRIENPKNRNKIILKSCKKNKDFLQELDYLKGGGFQYVNIDKDKNQEMPYLDSRTYVYNIIEIMHNINPKGSVVVEVEDNINFDEMLYFSNKIKREKKAEKNKLTDIPSKKNHSKELIKILEQKMEYFASLEEYEKAAQIKKDLQFVSKKDKMLNKLRREKMPILEYRKKFHL